MILSPWQNGHALGEAPNRRYVMVKYHASGAGPSNHQGARKKGKAMSYRILSRRSVMEGLAAGSLMLPPAAGHAAGKAETAVPPSVVTSPPRQWGTDAPPDVFPDPDVLPLDDSFNRLLCAIRR